MTLGNEISGSETPFLAVAQALADKEERTPKAIFSSTSLEEALSKSREYFNSALKDTRPDLSYNNAYDLQRADFFGLIAIAKSAGLPENHPLVLEANAEYVKAEVSQFITHFKYQHMEKANSALRTALMKHRDLEEISLRKSILDAASGQP